MFTCTNCLKRVTNKQTRFVTNGKEKKSSDFSPLCLLCAEFEVLLRPKEKLKIEKINATVRIK